MADAGGSQLAAAVRQAAALYETGQWAQCERLCQLILDVDAGSFEALHLGGLIAAQTGRAEEAARRLGRAVAVRPGDAGARNNHGLALLAAGRADDALPSFEQALRLAPRHAEAHNNRGNALRELGRWDEALESYDRALSLKPDTALAHNNRGLALQHLGRAAEALLSFDRAVRIAPDFADAHCNRADALHSLGRSAEALQAFDRAIVLAPDFATAFINRGVVLLDLHRPVEALADCDRALRLTPQAANAHNNRGNVLQFLSRLPEAVASYDAALALDPAFVAAHCNRANALVRMHRLPEALDGYGQVVGRDPGYRYAYGARLFTKARLCAWEDWKTERESLAGLVDAAKPVVRAFQLQALSDSEALLRLAAETEVRRDYPTMPLPEPFVQRPLADKIRVGYFSADYRVHPVGILTAGLFGAHDRSRFELIAFSSGPNPRDDLRQRFERSFDQFIDVRRQSDREIAALARQLRIDIAVDLSGLTEDSRPGVLALRAAPVQIGMIGFAGTMTAGLVDYLVADPTVIPPASRRHYGEKIIYLPHAYLPNDSSRPISARDFARADWGLPADGFVFCCFNNSYKLTPPVFGRWMRLLARVPDSILWLASGPPEMLANLRREAQSRGIAGERLVFAERTPSLADHLARHRLAGLALDTLPFNGHSTTIDALWAGLPVVTCTGTTFPGRVATSVLGAIDLSELVTGNLDEYEELALQLALQPQRLAALRQRLMERRLTTPLFDTSAYVRNLEAAYVESHRRRLAGLPPEDIRAGVKNP